MKKNGRRGRKVIISQRKRREKRNCATRALDDDEKIGKWLKELGI
jgi:hypothetical protein